MQSAPRTALAGMVMLALGMGISRFLLTPLLPLMQADAGLGLAAGGWLASINLAGYLAGALLCVFLPMRAGLAIRAGLFGVAVSTLGMGLTPGVAAWLGWRLLGGLASAALTVHGIAWSMLRLRAEGRESLEGVLFSGTGVGIVASGVLVALLAPLGVTSRALWIGFGLLCMPLAAAVWRTLDDPAPVPPIPSARAMPAMHGPSGPAWTLALAYGLMGFAYVVPATFLPLIAVEHLRSPALREWFWPLFGGATMIATLAMPKLPPRLDNRILLAACCTSMLAGIVLCVSWPTVLGLGIGTVLIGAVIMPFVMLVMREARLLAPTDPTRLIAVLTTLLGIGQMLGPVVAARLAQRSHGFALPMLVAAVVTALALCAILLRRTAPPTAPPRAARAAASLSARGCP
ncbi:YbfB/YjiJ family MFS transporter [Frateuria hangzhouensis]|uniref:YbfB/YjiJ family MFS transporter n=1 Tax=Frateuria hangzhouensis TaxID=2995589 RepID=UPI002260C6CA|nr:YbfB/YjiJ family MFS transporter [Frateuria sp. STR12]MCX7514744.1 YbfB/YjiJ family MFS transporter [Frateuria sp. STR12]